MPRGTVLIAAGTQINKWRPVAQTARLPVSFLKIDKAFVKELDEAEADASIAGVVIQLGRRLRKEVIAEGVETEDQAALLGRMGCPEAQGYLFGRPMPLDDLRIWIKNWSVRHA